MNYAVQYNALQRRYESLLADMRQVLGLLRRGRFRAALALLDSVLGDESDTSGRESEADALTKPLTSPSRLKMCRPRCCRRCLLNRLRRLRRLSGAASVLMTCLARLTRLMMPQIVRRSRTVAVAATARTCTRLIAAT